MPRRTSRTVRPLPRRTVVVIGILVVLAASAPGARARLGQTDQDPTTVPTTTTLLPPLVPPSTEPTTEPPPVSDTTSTTTPEATTTIPVGGDGTESGGLSPLGGGPGQIVPDDAAALIAGLARSAPNDNSALVAGERALLAAGDDPDHAARVAYGHFPVAGPAHWSDDWFEPRFTGTEFRYHLGVDVIAPYGTPLRAPDDGVIGVEQSDAGGLTVKVVLADSTFYELAHLSATAPGIEPGVAVHTGDLVGFVGATGDATGPHLHLGLWIGGATPKSAKPLLDQWTLDAAAALDALLNPRPPPSRSLLGTIMTRALTDGPAASGPTDLLLASAANPAGGALQVAKATASELAGSVDWARRADDDEAAKQAWAASSARAWTFLSPLTPKSLQSILAPRPSP